jgi:hypothetical protein
MQANGTSTWPFVRDPQFNYVTMLLHGDGSAGANNGSGGGATPTVTAFNTDASTNNFNVTINGDARSNNFSPYLGTGYYSNYFDGTSGQYLNAPANTVFNFGTGDFTVEAWVYPTSTSGTRPIIEIRTTGGANGFALLSQSGATTLNVYTNTAFVGASTNSLTLNAWNHVALTRSTNTWTYWINGVSGGSFTNSSTQSDGGTTGPKIGGSTTSGEIWIGYISNARITKGGALYTTTFTPSTTPLTTTVSSGTVSLLTSQNNRFIDNSVNAFTITVNGTPQVATAQPFALPSSVATYGSGYFDGTGDSLKVAYGSQMNLTNQDFAIEFWAYVPSALVNKNFLCQDQGYYQLGFFVDASNNLTAYSYEASTALNFSVSFGSVPVGQWFHIALTRSGSTVAGYKNGARQNTASFAGSVGAQTGGWYIASGYSGGDNVPGYMSDVRFVIGSNPYGVGTTLTVPSAPLTAITNTQLLTTQYNGGGNNSGFKDSSQNNFAITRNGNTTQGTFTPYGSNWSNYSDGNGYLLVADNAALSVGAGNFTIETWLNPASLPSGGNYKTVWSKRTSNGTTGGASLVIDSSGNYLFFVASGTGTWGISGTSSGQTASIGSWQHLAMVRSGNNLILYKNGVAGTTVTLNFTVADANAMSIMAGSAAGGQVVDGYVSNFRLVKGTAVYTSAFTPSTTPLTAISGTSLLTCQSNRFIDNSGNALTITPTTSPSVQRFNPFGTSTAYSTSVIGGSGYFDGSGDYLTAPSNSAFAMGTGDFTIECWINTPLVNANNDVIIELRSSGSTSTGFVFNMNPTGVGYQLNFYTDGGFNLGSTVLNYNVWNHVAVTRSGTTVRLFSNGAVSATFTKANNFSDTPTPYIGVSPLYSPSNLLGYMADLRVVKGTALYTSAFTPPTAPLTPTANTSLLLSTTNSAILDQSMMNDLETLGNAQISTSVVKYGTASMYFDGTGDYLIGRPNLTGVFGTGDFTIEAWVYTTVSSGTQCVFDTRTTDASATGYFFGLYSSNAILFYASGVVLSGGTVTANTWTHIAAVRSGTTVTLYVNGSSVASGTRSNNFTDTNVQIGSSILVAGSTANYFSGYIDDLRVTKYARYTTTFTPPTQALPNG